jgi:tetratricopeptide (TPR) repeat protein
MGNNEFVGPFGGNTVFGPSAPPATLVRGYLALQRTRLGQALVTLARKLNANNRTPANWGGMKMFLNQQLPPGDPRKERIYENFRQNLADIIHAGRQAGVPIILSTVASNLKDCSPFGSLHVPALDASKLANWESLSQAGITNAQQGDMAQAIRNFQAAATLSPNYAETRFQLGECFLALTNLDAARQNFLQARDLDSLPFRADSKLNSLLAEAARRFTNQGVVFLDAEQALAPSGGNTILGEEAFYEHVHLNFEGNFRLARALAAQVASCLPRDLVSRQKEDWAGADVCARDLALTDWNRYAVLEEVSRRLGEPPFTGQSNHRRQLEKLSTEMAQCRLRLRPAALNEARSTCEEALRKTPQVHWLHHNYAEFLTATGDFAAAAEQMRQVQKLIPQHHASYLHLGRLLARQQKFDDARRCFEEGMALRPDVDDFHIELGQVLDKQGNLEPALQEYAKARALHQDDARVCLLQAEVFEKQGKRGEAIQSLREATRLRPSYWEAYDRLGIELALSEKFSEAEAAFAQVVLLLPDYADGHLNLGIALARQGRFDDALEHFQATLRLEPKNDRAKEFISMLEQLKLGANAP